MMLRMLLATLVSIGWETVRRWWTDISVGLPESLRSLVLLSYIYH